MRSKTLKLICYAPLILLINSPVYCQEENFIKNYKYYIENESVISENKLSAHASFSSFFNFDEQVIGKSKYHKSLNGNWKFNWVKIQLSARLLL